MCLRRSGFRELERAVIQTERRQRTLLCLRGTWPTLQPTSGATRPTTTEITLVIHLEITLVTHLHLASTLDHGLLRCRPAQCRSAAGCTGSARTTRTATPAGVPVLAPDLNAWNIPHSEPTVRADRAKRQPRKLRKNRKLRRNSVLATAKSTVVSACTSFANSSSFGRSDEPSGGAAPRSGRGACRLPDHD